MRATGLLAVKRFGLGGRPGEVQEAATDPRGWLAAQIAPGTDTRLMELRSSKPEAPVRKAATTLDTWLQIRRFEIEEYVERRAEREAKPATSQAPQPAPAVGPAGPQMAAVPAAANAGSAQAAVKAAAPAAPDPKKKVNPVGPLYQGEIEGRFMEARATRRPLVERLAWFWSNHFAIGVQKSQMVRAVAGPYEREAIRPHVLGRFRDMVAAVVRHPAMLDYLDNARSTGPESLVGRWKRKGLNENLARELMELHVLGVDAGYAQADVTNLARILTGWTVADLDTNEAGRTVFLANAHEPGPITVLGKTYEADGPAGGAAQLDRVLDDLVAHPAAGRFVARKLVAHFVGPSAPPSLVVRLASEFTRTGGDLGAVTRALIQSDEAWVDGADASGAPGGRVIPPWDFAVATARALEVDLPIGMVFRLTDVLGQKTWEVPSPQGWTEQEDWGSPAALIERLDWADEISKRLAGTRDIRALAEAVIGPTLSTDTSTAISRAESRQQALTLLLMSPEFQRR